MITWASWYGTVVGSLDLLFFSFYLFISKLNDYKLQDWISKKTCFYCDRVIISQNVDFSPKVNRSRLLTMFLKFHSS